MNDMKVKVIESAREQTNVNTYDLLPGKVYEAAVVSTFGNWYRIVDESGEACMYHPSLFEIVEK